MTVTKQQQLEWLASAWDEWSLDRDFILMSVITIGYSMSPAIGASHQNHKITREEWQQERDKMQKQQTLGDEVYSAIQDGANKDNSWHERGELPPVGCECEFFGGIPDADDPWHPDLADGDRVTVIAHFKCGDFMLAAFTFKARNPEIGSVRVEQANYGCFRPLRTERERAIDEMADLIAKSVFGSAKCQAERLYDSGYRKVKP